MITDERVEKALHYLLETAEEYAQARTSERFYEAQLKRIEAQKFLEQQTGAVEAKRLAARASDEYGECLENYREAKYNSELLGARRDAAQLTISWAQSERRASSGGY